MCCAQVRDLYWTFRNFRNRVVDFLRYRRVTANMDERFAEALRTGVNGDPSFRRAAEMQRIIDAAVESAESERSVSLG